MTKQLGLPGLGGPTAICKRCATTFDLPPRGRGRRFEYCSRGCASAAAADIQRNRDWTPLLGLARTPRECRQCGRTFDPPASNGRFPAFCSAACRNAARRTRT